MKFNCEKALLQSALTIASRAVSPKSTIPALEGLLLEARDGVLFLTGYNQETGIRTSLELEVTEPGAIVLPARLFGEIIRKMPDDVISLQEKDKQVTLRCGMSEFVLSGLDAADFPELPTVEYQNSFSISELTMRSMISETLFAVSQDQSRPVITGTLFVVEDSDELTLVAVDGYRLALRREKVAGRNGAFQFVVPGPSLSEVEKICRETDDPMEIHQGERHVLFKIGDTILISRRLEGQFLAWRQAIPRNNPINVTVNRRELLGCIERVSLIVSEKLKSSLNCVLGEGKIDLSTKTAIGHAQDCCTMEGSGQNLEIGFNNRYLMDALRVAPADTIKLEFSSPITPCIMVPAEGEENFLFMILPVRLRSER